MTFGTLFLIGAAALLGPILSAVRRFPLPLTLGQIAGGIIIGPHVLKLLDVSDVTLLFLSQIGFALMMLQVGGKLPINDPDLRKALGKGIAASICATALSFVAAYGFSYFIPLPLPLLMLLISCSSTAVVAPMLQERGLAGHLVMQIIAWVLVSDITPVIIFPLTIHPADLKNILIGCALVLLIAFASIHGMRWFRNSKFGRAMRKFSKERGWALDLRLDLEILWGMSFVASLFGTNALVPGFAAGVVTAMTDQPGRYLKQLTGLASGLFIPLFFVTLGARLDFGAVFTNWHYMALTGSVTVASIVVHLITAKIFRFPMAAGFLASSQQGLPIAIVSVGLTEHMLDPGQAAAIIGSAVLLLGSAAVGTNLLSKIVPAATPPKVAQQEGTPPVIPVAQGEEQDDN